MQHSTAFYGNLKVMVSPLPKPENLPLLFAHRGGMAHAPENSEAAFRFALESGIGGLESDVRITADGVAVLAHDSRAKKGLLPKNIAKTTRAALPNSVMSLADLYQSFGCDFELSLDIKVPEALAAAVNAAREAEQHLGQPVLNRLWLCHPDWSLLARWREQWSDIRLVNSAPLNRLADGPERRCAQLSEAGIDALNFPHPDWNAGLVTLAHRFEVLAFAWDAHHERIIKELMQIGVDGIYGDHVDRLLRIAENFSRSRNQPQP